MRFNFGRYDSTKDARRRMLRALIEDLSNDYDIEITRVQSWVKTKKGLEQFVRYLDDAGYKAKIYSWPADDKEPMSWGLEFEDDNPSFVALRLKHSNDGDFR